MYDIQTYPLTMNPILHTSPFLRELVREPSMLTVCQHANYLSLSIHGSVHGSTFYLVLFISNYLFIVIPYICISLSMYSSIYFCLYRYLSIYLSIYLYILYLTIIFVLSTYVCQFFCLSIHLQSLSIYLPILISIYLSLSLEKIVLFWRLLLYPEVLLPPFIFISYILSTTAVFLLTNIVEI